MPGEAHSSLLARVWKDAGSSFWARVIVGAAILLLPAIINGFPFWFYDTAGYHLVGRSIVTHLAEMLAHADAPAPAPVDGGGGSVSAQPDQNASLTYAGGRSPFYSLFLFLSSALGSYWFAAIAQALVASWLISTSLRVLGRASLRDFLVVIGAMTAFTALPFFAAQLMPDVLTGFVFIAIVLVFVGGETIGAIERWALVLVIAATAVSHQTNLPLGLLLIVLALIAGRLLRLPQRAMLKRAGVASIGLAAAVAANAAYALATKAVLGESAGNPPYLMARVLADGPGRLYLRDVCAPTPRFEICRYADRSFTDVNGFLWSPDPRVGVYMLAEVDSRRRLMAEERSFVIGVVTHYPLEQLAASSGNALRQLVHVGVRPELELARHSWVQMHFNELSPSDDARARASLAFRGAFPFRVIDSIDGAAIVLAIAFLLWRLTRSDVRASFRSAPDAEAEARRALTLIAACLALWLAANAVLCGVFSGVFDRYQARAIWIAPMLALLTLLRIGAALPVSVSRTSTAAAPRS
jgi:hypothetical protein